MTIRRGEPWGTIGTAPPDVVVVRSDASARDWVLRVRGGGEVLPPLGLGGGDLARTAGGGRPERFTGEVAHVPLDLVRVEADGETTWGVAHVVARREWLRGRVVLAMNAQYLGEYDVAPRAHPNDGLLDVVEVLPSMGVRARLAARRRARTGTHLPHPGLAVHRTAAWQVEFPRPAVVWVDGVRWRTARSLAFTVEPDAYTAYV